MRKEIIIIINGASCSGKTTICKEICKQSNDNFVHLQIDETKNFLFTILDRQKTSRNIGRPICDEILLQTGMIFLKNNKNIIIDTTFDGEDGLEIAKKHINFFKNNNYNVIFIGIDCPLEERLKRFKNNNNNPRRNETTIIEQSNVFDLCKSLYKSTYNTLQLSSTEIIKEMSRMFNLT